MNDNILQFDAARGRRMPAFLAVLALMTPAAFAQISRDLVEEALDQPLDSLEIRDTPIRDALALVEQRTGLRFVIDEHTLELMPYGPRTRISVAVANMSVRTGLTQVLDGLGLRMYADQGDVVIVPAPVLERLGGRLSIEEVGVLSTLAATDWAGLRNLPNRPPFEFHLPPESDPRAALERALERSAAPNVLRQLDSACAALRWAWRPEDNRVVFESQRSEIQRRLDWPLDLAYQREPLDRLLTDLGNQVGVLVKFEPGALAKVAAAGRTVDLIQRGVSVRQILERICGNTGLRYQIDDDGVRILAPLDVAAGPTAPTIQQWVRIGVEIQQGVTMDVFIRQDQLPDRLQERMREKLSEILNGD